MTEGPAIVAAVLLFSVALLAMGAEWVVTSAARISHRAGLSDLVIGLTVVALGTSAPEFVVTLLAAIDGKPDISIGNVVGSNIFNTGVVLGVCAMFWTLPTSVYLARRDVPLLLGATLFVLLVSRDGRLDPFEGLAMFGVLVGYLWWLMRRGRGSGMMLEEVPHDVSLKRDIPRLLGGLAMVCGGAHLLVTSASALAEAMGASQWLIGVTIVAAGTSLPEFATSVMAGRRGHHGIILGNLIGSDLFNMLGVLGLAAFLNPLGVGENATGGLWMMVGAIVLLLLAVLRGTHVLRPWAVVLVVVGLGRWAVDVFFR
jgi:cation:H+ antiporter